MSKQTAMQQLLTQIREERNNLPIPIEWCRAYQSIEMMIQHTYIQLEKDQHKETWLDSTAQFDNAAEMTYKKDFDQYYNETFKK